MAVYIPKIGVEIIKWWKNNEMMKKMENGETVIGMLRHMIIGLWYRSRASALRLGLATMRRNIQRWRRNIGGNIGGRGASPNRVEAFCGSCGASLWDLDRPQEPSVFHDGQEAWVDFIPSSMWSNYLWLIWIPFLANGHLHLLYRKLWMAKKSGWWRKSWIVGWSTRNCITWSNGRVSVLSTIPGKLG